jgi:hypothetical protein
MVGSTPGGPILTGVRAVLVAVRIGVTVPLLRKELARRTYTVRPSGVMVIACANGPTLTGFSTVPVAVRTGTTLPSKSATYRVAPSR